MKQIIQIVPRLPPAIDGVGDYASLLAKQLRASHDIQTVFVVCDPAWKSAEILKADSQSRGFDARVSGFQLSNYSFSSDGFPVHQLKERSPKEMLRVLSLPGMPPTILLQFVGYGYHKRGCPVWLLHALREWKNGIQKSVPTSNPRPLTAVQSSKRRLVIMFHELYATGSVWSSAFWTSRVQQWVAKSLAILSARCVTNLTICAGTLQKLTRRDRSYFTVLPVFSNIGEPNELPVWNDRQLKMIVFGSASWRQKIYFEFQTELEAACHTLGLTEVVDIGAVVEIPQLSVRVSRRGVLPSAEASREMLNARAGFFAYPVHCLGKSGIFAAYAAHGLVPVTFLANNAANADGLKRGEHYFSTDELSGCDPKVMGKIGMSVNRWYQEHNAVKQAIFFAAHINATD